MKGEMEMSIADQITRLKNAKESIKTSVANKGTVIPENTTLDQYPEYIDQIQTAGNYQAKTVTPTANGVTVNPDAGYDALSSVTVNGDSNLIADNVKKGVTIFDVTGTLESGGQYQEKTVTPTANGQTVMPDAGYDALSRVNIYGDEDLVPNNIKEGVSIFGVAGTYSGGGYDLNLIGYDLDIEAGTTITKGQRIVATKNTSATGKTVATSSSGANLGALSLDESIGFLANTSFADGAQLVAYGIDELGVYEPIATGTVSGIADAKAKYSNGILPNSGRISSTNIDSDGSHIVTYVTESSSGKFNGGTLIIGKINKSSNSISFTNVDISDIIFENYAPAGGVYLGAKLDKLTAMVVHDGHVFISCYASPIKVSDGLVNTDTTLHAFLIGKLTSNGMIITYKEAFVGNISPVGQVVTRENGNYLINFDGSMIAEATENDILKRASFKTSLSVYNFSKNGKYVGTNSGTNAIRVINDDLSLRTICTTSSNYQTYPSDDGAYFITGRNNGLRSATDPNTRIGAAGTMLPPTCGALSTPNRVVSGTSIYALVPSTEAEYTARQLSSFTMESGKIYGIASESLTVGQRGTARGLFNTN